MLLPGRPLSLGFVTGIFPPDIGGPASYVSAVAIALAGRHWVKGVITLSEGEGEGEGDSCYPFPVVRLRRKQNRLLRRLRTVAAVRQLAGQVDVLIVAGLPFEAAMATTGPGGPAVVHRVVGDLVWERAHLERRTTLGVEAFQKQAESRRDRWLHSLQTWVTRRGDAVMTPSRYLAGIVAEWGVNPGRIFVVPNACLREDSREDDRVPQTDLVTVGRLIPLKRFDDLIRVAAAQGWSLDIAGEGPERAKLERLAASLDARGIRFLGAVPIGEVRRVLGRGKLFVLNSVHETFPHAVLEAMEAGIPVVARSVGGIPEAIEDGIEGRLVPPHDDRALTAAIRELLEDPERRRRMGAAGLERVRRDFSFDTMVERTERLLVWAARNRHPS